MRIFTLLLFLVCSEPLFAQSELDSLRHCIYHCQKDSVKFQALMDYARKTPDRERSIAILDSTLKSGKWKNNPKARLELHSLLAQKYYEDNLYRNSISHNSLYQEVAFILKDTSAIINANNRFNILYYRLSKPDSSLFYLNRNYDLLKNSSDTFQIGANLNGLGLYYINNEDFPRALEYLNKLKKLAFSNKSGDRISLLGAVYGNLGMLYGKWDKLDSAEFYLQKKLEILPGNIAALNELGLINKRKENFPRALEYFQQIYDYAMSNGNTQVLAASANNLAVVYNLQAKYPQALKYGREGEAASSEMERADWLIISLQEQLKANKKLGNYADALNLSERLRVLEDSVKSAEVQERVADLESTYQLKEKTTELELSKSRNELQQMELNRKTWQNRIAVILIILVLIIIALVVIYNGRLRKAKENLTNANALKDRFFAIVAHDLKGGVSGFSGVGPMLEYYITQQNSEAAVKLAREVESESQRMESMLDNLLKWAFLQLDHINMRTEKVDVGYLVKERLKELKLPLESKHLKVKLELKEGIATGDPDALAFVLRNLLSNAIKFSHSGGNIVIGSKRNKKVVEIYVQDEGVGMNTETLSRLFKPSEKITHKGTAGEKGNGLGLILSKEFTERIKGELKVNSVPREGTVFHIILPAA